MIARDSLVLKQVLSLDGDGELRHRAGMNLHHTPDDILPLHTEREITERYLKAVEARRQLRELETKWSQALERLAHEKLSREEHSEVAAQCFAYKMEHSHLKTHVRCAILLFDCATMDEEHCGQFAGRA